LEFGSSIFRSLIAAGPKDALALPIEGPHETVAVGLSVLPVANFRSSGG
jgi:hypothetical protein